MIPKIHVSAHSGGACTLHWVTDDFAAVQRILERIVEEEKILISARLAEKAKAAGSPSLRTDGSGLLSTAAAPWT